MGLTANYLSPRGSHRGGGGTRFKSVRLAAGFSALSVKRLQLYFYAEIDKAIRVQTTLHRDRAFIIPVRLRDCDIPEIPIDTAPGCARYRGSTTFAEKAPRQFRPGTRRQRPSRRPASFPIAC